MTYSFINETEGIGATINTALKGGAQFGTQTINAGLDPSFGLVQIAALGLLFVILGFALSKVAEAKNATKRAF